MNTIIKIKKVGFKFESYFLCITDFLNFIIEYPSNAYPINPTTRYTPAATATDILLDKIINNKGDTELPIA